MDTQKLKKSRLTQSLKPMPSAGNTYKFFFWGGGLIYDTSGSLFSVLWAAGPIR